MLVGTSAHQPKISGTKSRRIIVTLPMRRRDLRKRNRPNYLSKTNLLLSECLELERVGGA